MDENYCLDSLCNSTLVEYAMNLHHKYMKNNLKVIFSAILIVFIFMECCYAKPNTIHSHLFSNLVIKPSTIEEIRVAVEKHKGKISIGGGYYSMGSQTALEDSLHIDMSALDKIVAFSPKEKLITVQSGITWRKIQEYIDPYNLSVKIMQTYSDFSVGGSLSVNAHGRYVGLGPLILSVIEIKMLLANGSIVTASPEQNKDLFYGAVGGYGFLGVIVEATLSLADNVKMERKQKTLLTKNYPEYFAKNIRNDNKAIFHNTNLYPPSYTEARSITWVQTDKPLILSDKLIPNGGSYFPERALMWLISNISFGKWFREYIVDPIFYFRDQVVWRNYEAGYNVDELEPASHKKSTYVLQEYFVPVEKFTEFTDKMKEILNRYKVNVINVSVRHSKKDPGSTLAWAMEEVFAFVIYYNQGVSTEEVNKTAVWTRELIDAAIKSKGTYYLPYKILATVEQFHAAYPNYLKLFEIKKKFDPDNKFSNNLWDKYYQTSRAEKQSEEKQNSYFHKIYSSTEWRDKFYLFLQNVYNIYPEDAFNSLIDDACRQYSADKEIYEYIQQQLPSIKPIFSIIKYTLPALKKQKQEMARQTIELLGEDKMIVGYAEIGSSGRYVGAIKKYIKIKNPIYLIDDQEATYSFRDIAERGSLFKIGEFVSLSGYNPISANLIPDHSLDVVTSYIGLHHIPLDKLDGFLRSIHRVLKDGGSFIIRDHNVNGDQMRVFISLAHMVFNAGLGESWRATEEELQHFTSTEGLSSYIQERGFRDSGKYILQAHDPSQNTLMQFIKVK